MRLNKKKLAALAMSAVMAASTMPFPVLAEEFTDMGDATVTVAEVPATPSTQTGAISGVELTAELDENGAVKTTATWTATDGSHSKTADVTKTYPADCTNAMRVDLSVWIDNIEYTAKAVTVDGAEALGHDWDEANAVKNPTKPATCGDNGAGEMTVTKTCKRCGETTTKKESIPALAHDWEVLKTEYCLSDGNTTIGELLSNVKVQDGKIVLGSDGKPQVVDHTKVAYYYEKVTKKCKVGGETAVTYDRKTIAGNQVIKYVVTGLENIVTNSTVAVGTEVTAEDFQKFKTDVASLELLDCSKEGKISLMAKVDGDENAGSQIVTVPAHHQKLTKVEVASKDDQNLLKVETDATGKITVTNLNCKKDVTYYVTEYCTVDITPDERNCDLTEKPDKKYLPYSTTDSVASTAWRVIKRTAAVAPASTSHVIDSAVKASINDLVAGKSNTTDNVYATNNVLTEKGVAKLIKIVKATDAKYKYIKVSDNTATCTKDGTVTVSFTCHLCDKVIDTLTVKTAALGHNYEWTIDKATEVAATCQARGHYEKAYLCKRCGEEKPNSERTTYYVNRSKHTNETAITTSGTTTSWQTDYTKTNAYIKFIGDKVIDIDGGLLKLVGKDYTTAGHQWAYMTAEFYTNCDTCGAYEHKVDVPVKIKVAAVEKENASGAAGYIKLSASYDYSVNNKVVKTFTKEITVPYFSSMAAYLGRTETVEVNGLHEDKDGVFRYYVNGEFDSTYTGIVEYGGREFFVSNGLIAKASGLNEYNGKWYFLSNGQIQSTYTGLALYDGEWFYLTNGVLSDAVSGLVPYNGGTFLFADGRLLNKTNGLWQDSDGTWYYLALGQVQTQHTGVVEYDGAFFYVRNGRLATDYNGTVEYDGAKFNVVAGQLYDKVA